MSTRSAFEPSVIPLVEMSCGDAFRSPETLSVPPRPENASPATVSVNDPVSSVPRVVALPSVTVEAFGIALSTPRASVPEP